MNRTLALLLAAALCACANPAPDLAGEPLSAESSVDGPSANLIVFYDAQTGSAPLLQALGRCGATVLYAYRSFNALAVSPLKSKSANEVAACLRQVEGVLTVNREQILHLH